MSKAPVSGSTTVLRLVPRRHRGIAILVTAALAAMLLSGCVPSGSSGDGSATGDTNLYMGALPVPAAMPESPHLPPFPRASTNTDPATTQAYNAALTTYSAAFQASTAKVKAQAAAIKKLAADTKKGGGVAVAAWESLLVTAGIAVEGPNGKQVSLHGDTGAGWPTTDGELRLLSMLAATPGGVRLEDLAEALAPTVGTTKDDLAQSLYTELYTITDRDFSAVYDAMGPGLFVNKKKVELADVVLNWAQIELLLRRLAVEIENASIGFAKTETSSLRFEPGANPSITLASYQAPRSASAPCEPSDKDPWAKGIIGQTQKAITQMHDLILDHVEAKAVDEGHLAANFGDGRFDTAGNMLVIARVLLAYLSLAAKMAAIEATFDLANAPLVRTKDRRPGEVRDLTVAYTFNAGKWEKIRSCLNLALGFIGGLELPGTSPTPPSDMDVQLKSDDPDILRIGDGTGKDKKVDSDVTDSDGKASFKLSGAPQQDRIPDEATPDDLTVGIQAVNDLKTSKFWDDMLSLPWDAADTVSAVGLNLLPDLISRMKFITFRDQVPVRDWKLSADFQVTAVGEVTEQLAYNEEWEGCGSTTSHDESVKGIGTFASDSVNITAKLLSNPEGNLGGQAFVFVPKGDEFVMRDAGQGDGVYMFDMPVSYKTEKSYSEPGTWKKPELYVEHLTDCFGGGGLEGDVTPVDDCGVRDYTSTLQATMPKARHLYVAGAQASTDRLWNNCGSPLYPYAPPVAPAIGSCDSPKVAGGKVPSTADIFDASKKQLEISGTMTCTSEGQGSIQELDYNWTLQLCRIENGKPDC